MKTNTLFKTLAVMMVVSTIFLMVSNANANRGCGPSGRQQGPPPEAIEACAVKQPGDSVTYSGPNGESMTAMHATSGRQTRLATTQPGLSRMYR